MLTHTHTHTHIYAWPWLKHTQTGGRGWHSRSHSPALCWFWAPFRDFLVLSFPSLTSQCENVKSQLRLSSCSQETSQSTRVIMIWCYQHAMLVRMKERFIKQQLSPLAQSVSKTASKMNNTIFRTPILSKDNFMFPKSERHMATVTQGVLYTNP